MEKDHEKVDEHLRMRVPLEAGRHQIGVTFLKNPASLLETKRQPYEAHYNMHRHPRLTPAIYQISITGPYDSKSPGESPSRRKIFVSQPANSGQEDSCAEQILSSLIRRAYRRPVTTNELQKPMEFYRQAKAQDGFEAGIEAALSAEHACPPCPW